MVSRLRPLDVNLVFKDRTYKMGETINLTVELTPRGDVEVREGRVDLICEERWFETYTVMMHVTSPREVRLGATATGVLATRVPKLEHKAHRETFVHSSVIFLEDMHLGSDYTGRYDASLEIQLEPVPHVGAKVKWSLITVIDVAQARDIKKRRTVKVMPA